LQCPGFLVTARARASCAEAGRAGILISREETMNAETRHTGKVICAWCGAELGEKEGVNSVSHGICEPCKERQTEALVAQMREEMEDKRIQGEAEKEIQFLEGLSPNCVLRWYRERVRDMVKARRKLRKPVHYRAGKPLSPVALGTYDRYFCWYQHHLRVLREAIRIMDKNGRFDHRRRLKQVRLPGNRVIRVIEGGKQQ
jgi:uncharacterized Zn finger protein (UPF0148 family)